MTTVEQGGDQLQGVNSTTQTRNPQQAPANLQPNGAVQNNIQNVVTGTNLFSNPQTSAIVTVSGSELTAESLVAADADTSVKGSSTPQTSVLIIATVALIIVGSFLIIRRFSSNN